MSNPDVIEVQSGIEVHGIGTTDDGEFFASVVLNISQLQRWLAADDPMYLSALGEALATEALRHLDFGDDAQEGDAVQLRHRDTGSVTTGTICYIDTDTVTLLLGSSKASFDRDLWTIRYADGSVRQREGLLDL